jgi:hypothetical protein
MKVPITLVGLLLLAVSVATWALIEKRETEQLMLSGLYFSTATEIRNYTYILSKLREGDPKDARAYLERILETRVAILEGCKNDLCSESMPEQYSEALKIAKEYKTRYQPK